MQNIPAKESNSSIYVDILHKPMAELVIEGNHDLVIEVANAIDSDVFYQTLVNEDYKGNYLALNPFHANQLRKFNGETKFWPSLETTLEHENSGINKFLRSLSGKKYYGEIGRGMFHGDALSNKDIEDVIDLIKPENPVYVTNNAIGIILSYRPKEWVGYEQHGFSKNYEGLSKMADVWAQNLTKTPLKRALMSDYILNSESPKVAAVMNEKGHNYWASYSGVSEALYFDLLDKFRNKGWKISEKPLAKSDYSEFKILELSR